MEFKKEIKKESFAIKISAHEGDKAIGWVYLYVIFQDRHEDPYGYLENVYVEQEYRSRGVGTGLIEAAIREARDRSCYKIIGTSRCVNEKVHAFYERFGMRKHGYEFRLDLKESKVRQRD